MKNTVQKYLFYLKQQNIRPKKYVLQHTLTTKYRTIKPINKIKFKYKKTRPISDGFRKNNVNYWAFREIRSIIPHL